MTQFPAPKSIGQSLGYDQEPIDNFITGLLDLMYFNRNEHLMLESGKKPYYLSYGPNVLASEDPDSEIVDTEELIEDMASLRMNLLPGKTYRYRHLMNNPLLTPMRMDVSCLVKDDGCYTVSFRRLGHKEDFSDATDKDPVVIYGSNSATIVTIQMRRSKGSNDD